MKDIYILKSLSGAQEYIKLEGNVEDIKIPVMKSEIQHLDKKRIELTVSEEGGLEVPDLIYYEGLFLLSSRLKQLLDSRKMDYVFWKGVDIQNERLGIHESFWLIVPPRIDAIDRENSDLVLEWNFDYGLIPLLKVNKVVIRDKAIGRFELFKLLGVMDNNIYVTKELYDIIVAKEFEGIGFIKI